MNDSLHRYSRHMVMPEIGVNGQQTLLDSSALIVGAGGLGSAAALYLAAAGVGTIHIADPDEVEISNLQRQILHSEKSLGRAKVDSAKARLNQLNSDIEIVTHAIKLDETTLPELVKQVDIVIDGCDNFSTRFAVNAACVQQRTALVSGAAIRNEGQITSFTPGIKNSPCYRCLYNHSGADQDACDREPERDQPTEQPIPDTKLSQ